MLANPSFKSYYRVVAKVSGRALRPVAKVDGKAAGGFARAAALSPERRREIGRKAAEARWKRAETKAVAPDRSRELEWIAAHRLEFADLWIAVEGDELIASNLAPGPVFAAVQARGIAHPFVVHLDPLDSVPFSGW
jgi:hypothetical protein